MKTILMALLLVVMGSNVYSADPVCSTPVCSSLMKCIWNCEATSGDDQSADSTCTADDGTCTVNTKPGTCKPGCVKDPAKPDCSQSTCTAPKQCGWTCIDGDKNVIYTVDASGCTSTDAACGQNQNTGTCKAGCLPADPVCSDSCTDSQTCSWTCKESDEDGALPDADVTKCGSVAHECTSGDKSGTCTSECVAKTGSKSGSSKIEVFAPFLVLGTFTKVYFQP